MGILSFILFLLVAAACAFLAERMVPNSMPGGLLISSIVGIIGAWVGGSLVGHFGPDLAGVSLIPCIIGSAVFVFLFSLIAGGIRKKA
ncbi:GlsB/YeaQ/YmgE family stress response membrane protein [soil metagenome]